MINRIRLSELIIIQESSRIVNKLGGYKIEWQNISKSWAHVESLFNKRQLGHEIAIAKEVISANFYQFTVRFSNKLNGKMRLIWRQRKFEITKIIDTDSKKQFMQLITQEII